MSAPLLALDLGNSRLKACLFAAVTEAPIAILGVGEPLEEWLAGLPRPRMIALSAVADSRRREELAQLLAETCGRAPRVDPPCGLELDLETPETTGVDRLYAARAALARVGGPCVVVDAGTALTVDAARPGVFLGGAIAPGPTLLARALAEGAAQLPRIDPDPLAAALGRSTRAALRSGVAVGFQGAARELVLGVSREAGLPQGAPIVLTGGARGFVEAVLGELPRPLFVDPFLVLRGLALSSEG